MFKFYFGHGPSTILGGPGGGIYFRPKAKPYELGERLLERGFIVARDEKANPPFARLIIRPGKIRWLLQLNNCRIPREIAKMMIRRAGTPN